MINKLIYVIVVLGLIPTWANAFDHKFTHIQLTEQAVNNSEQLENTLIVQLGTNEGVKKELNNGKDTYTITKWLQKGSKEEDEPACRASNHFHNPLKSWEQAQLTDTSFWVDDWCYITSPYRIKHSNLVWATGFIDKDQTPLPQPVNNILDPDNGKNGRNWSVARDQFYFSLIEQDPQQREAFFAETFRSLGYVLHLLQDMAVPAHTRNDFSEGHFQNIGCPEQGDCVAMDTKGNPFEGYVRNHLEDEIKPLIVSDISKPFIGEKILTNFWDTDTHVPDTTLTNFTGQDLGLAEYTNANFVSYSTIFKDESDTEHYFQYPNTESITDEDFPDQIDQRIYNILSRDNKLDKGVYISKSKNGEQIDKFLKPRYIPYVYGADWDTKVEKRYDLKFTLDDPCYLEYAAHLIPRAIGYSASLLDYFFRGKLEISPPDQYVYSIIDGKEIDPVGNTQLVKILKAKVRNDTPDEEMLSGSLVALAKYKKVIGYQPDLSSGSPSAGMREETFSYSVSEPIEIQSLSSTTPEEFTFDFTSSPIPVGITDLYLQVVFKGKLGYESEGAIAVGMKDLREPQHLTIWNDTDYFQLNGVPMTADEVRSESPLVEQFAYIDPFPFTETIGFSRFFPDVDAQTKITISDLPPARYSRIIVIADADDASYYLTDRIVADWPEFDPPDFDGTWKYSIPTIIHQEESDGTWNSSPVYRVRDVFQHYTLYFMNAYPELYYINNLPAPPENESGPYPVTIH